MICIHCFMLHAQMTPTSMKRWIVPYLLEWADGRINRRLSMTRWEQVGHCTRALQDNPPDAP